LTLLGFSLLLLPLLLGIWGAARNPSRTFLISFALLPWAGVDADPGLRVTVFQLYYLPLFIRYILTKSAVKDAFSKRNSTFLVFLLYGFLVSLIMLPFLPQSNVSGGALRSPEVRSMVQMFMLLFSVSPFFLAMQYCKTEAQFIKALQWYVLSCITLATLGFYQLVVWYASGQDPMPVGFVSSFITPESTSMRSGQFGFEGQTFFRMSSLGGEPKNLGQSILLAILVLLWGHVCEIRILGRGFLPAAIFLFVALFFTQSTSAFFSLFIGFVGVVVFGAGVSRQKVHRLVTLGVIVSVLFAILASISAQFFEFSIFGVVEERTLTRVRESSFGYLEDFDAAVVDFLYSDPLAAIVGVGLGNAHLFSDIFLAPEVAIYASGTSFTPKSGVLKIWSEMGLAGLLLFFVFFADIWQRQRLMAGDRFLPLMIVVLFTYMLVGTISSFYFVVGMVASVAGIQSCGRGR